MYIYIYFELILINFVCVICHCRAGLKWSNSEEVYEVVHKVSHGNVHVLHEHVNMLYTCVCIYLYYMCDCIYCSCRCSTIGHMSLPDIATIHCTGEESGRGVGLTTRGISYYCTCCLCVLFSSLDT